MSAKLLAAATVAAALLFASGASAYEAYVTKNVEVQALDDRNGIGIYIIGAVVLGLKVQVETCKDRKCLIRWEGKAGWIDESAVSTRIPIKIEIK